MNLEIALLLKKILEMVYSENVYEIRILYNHHRLVGDPSYSVELKTASETQYFEDEESVLLHIEGVL